jgi:ATP-dependent Zn protease
MDSKAWTNVALTWVPILFMLGAFLFFLRKTGAVRQAKHMDRNLAFMDRQEQLLERIAIALERSNARRE